MMMLYYAKLKEKRLLSDIDRAWHRISEYNIGDYKPVVMPDISQSNLIECPYDVPAEIYKVGKMEEELIKLQIEIIKGYEDVQGLIFEKKRIQLMIGRLQKMSLKRNPVNQGFRAIDELRRDDLIIGYNDRILEIDDLILKHEFKKQICSTN